MPALLGQEKPAKATNETPIDFARARQLFEKERRGEKLTPDEQRYLERAKAARRDGKGGANPARGEGKPSVQLTPLCDMTAAQRYKGQDGGLYGKGQNQPPAAHRQAAAAELARIQPLDADGQLSATGIVAFVSISMSNATQEFSTFKRLADAEPAKASNLVIVDCAQGGQAMAEWADAQARPWSEAARRLQNARVAPKQVQVAWVKLANKGPRGELDEHGRKLERDTLAVLQHAKKRFPNLRVAYLSSRIYGGYSTGPLNPEPYAYESAFVARWLIQKQIAGDASLRFDDRSDRANAPLLLWGPYLWADGVKGRKADKLSYQRADLGPDGTHPSQAGREKVARLMLEFFKTDELARSWFAALPQ